MAKRRKISDDPMVRAVRAHGMSTVMRALGFVAAWVLVAERLGHAPTLDEYRDWWQASERTTFREQAAFRKVSGLDDPTLIWERAKAAGVEVDAESARAGGGLALVPFMHWAVQ